MARGGAGVNPSRRSETALSSRKTALSLSSYIFYNRVYGYLVGIFRIAASRMVLPAIRTVA